MLLPEAVLQSGRSAYRIIRELGRGGTGRVYLAEELGVGRWVAIKETGGASGNMIAARDTATQLLQEEAGLMKRLNHPNVARVFEVFSQAERAYLVMEYIEGRDLWQDAEQALLSRTPLPLAPVLDWMVQASAGLAYLHARDIVHRDIKPHNMRVRSNGSLVLIDLGIAKEGVQKATGPLKRRTGTPPFAPIEQYGGGTTYASDVYALGICLYIFLTATMPPDSKRRMALDEDVASEMKRPSTLNRRLPPELEQVILRATQMDQMQRYINGTELWQALRAVTTGSTTAPEPASAAHPVLYRPKFCRNCGSKVASQTAKFCIRCGNRLA